MRLTAIGKRYAALIVVAVLMAGCASTEPAAPPERLGLKLSPASLGASISLQQHLTVERNGRTDQLDAALEIDPKELNMVGLALGQRVLTLHYDGKTLESWRHRMLPSQVRADDVLEDTQLTLWPVEAIRKALPEGWKIEQQGLRRTLLRDGVPVTVIVYSNASPWSGKVELTNIRYDYRLTIESVGGDSSSTPINIAAP
ncbi:DUF3261 domain-containing protein [Glaciimonas sp. Gout2]|uniref:DUF3261 domain-containing protein n=1 Tax=unclassified Glaciimonas TaxID=2644401 RepID=UPI002B2264C7|nr:MULTISPECIES: DUF3261 domain-containing protein [unclassified Glaciimonas]MEB0013044.1 DUF3261 domain-containing protein [Glaciimonas sp. Cout2]MEB0083611.1 DUF3261 domain-containing protein [Glaciimonas sp. Gout2]